MGCMIVLTKRVPGVQQRPEQRIESEDAGEQVEYEVPVARGVEQGADHGREQGGADVRTAPGMPDEDLVTTLSQYLELDPIERQALLEIDGALRRAEALIELVEMKLLMARTPGGPPKVSH